MAIDKQTTDRTGTSRLVLASGSPRRREILAGLGLEPEIRPVDLDETPLAGEDPVTYVRRLARAKASAEAGADEIVLAADTIVVLDGQLLGKPVDTADAVRMLRTLSGRDHQVYTGVAVMHAPDLLLDDVSRTTVTIAELSERDIAWYVATGEPSDKAGAYAIQGLGALLVESIVGNYSNVVGLPLPTVRRLLAATGIDLRQASA